MRSEIQNQPTPEQLFELAGLCMEMGKQKETWFGRHRPKKDSRFFNVDTKAKFFNVDFVSPPDQAYRDYIYGEESVSVSRKFMGKVVLRRFMGWSMSIKEVNHVFKGSDPIDQTHIYHKFEWGQEGVTKAVRSFHHGIENEEGSYESYEPESVDVLIFQPDFVSADESIRTVSAGDCLELRGSLDGFLRELKQAA